MFLSYAKEDSAIAKRVSDALRKRDVEVYRFEDTERQGDRFMQVIPQEIDQSDFFLALVSPAAFASEFCQAEHHLAVHRELTLGVDFIYVLEVVSSPKTGWLRLRSWIDLTPQATEEKLTNAVMALPLAKKPHRAMPGSATFRNRDQELDRVLDALTTFGGLDHWVVLSPPKMGKSWFLEEVKERFTRTVEGWTKLVDLRREDLDTRYDAVRVLSRLLDVELPDPLLDEDTRLEEIAGAVARRAIHHLVLLDSAELMDRNTTGKFRSALGRLRKFLLDSPLCSRLSVIVGSRRGDGWTGAGTGTGDRFRQLPLTGFELMIVRQVIGETGLPFREQVLDDWSTGLHRLSKGLPALLVSSLGWAAAKSFVNPGSCGNGATFDAVVAPYIRRELLSIHSLIPQAGERLVERHEALITALQVLAPYRMVTISHLKHHLKLSPEFRTALEEAGWNQEDLWTAIAGTALLSHDNEVWLSHYPPIRQLLYEHFYRDVEERRDTHVTALCFYEGWSSSGAGTEQPKVLVEALWHEAMRLCCTNPSDLPGQLPAAAGDLARRLIRPALYTPAEIEHGVRLLLFDDDEIVGLTNQYDGLLDEVLNQVRTAIGGGG
ncbi:toll/interleukin-1 receptor domain-containing protein [Lentzea sp. NPDC060358]|uniref:toll/interleukin-1 receptor domain-containing protein n=1 Tax=Lentzea sp. NPDC060358 TaxID=3347103 RepID=UPI0036464FCA